VTPDGASELRRRRRLRWTFAGLAVALLLAGVVTLGSFNLPFEPRTPTQVVILYGLSTFIVAALLVFAAVLARSLLRSWAERRAGVPGSRFKTKMVAGAMAISLLPVVALFFISYALLNRTLSKWFPRPLEIAAEEGRKLLDKFHKEEQDRLLGIAQHTRQKLEDSGTTTPDILAASSSAIALERGADETWLLNADGQARRRHHGAPPGSTEWFPGPRVLRVLPSGGEIVVGEGNHYLAVRVPLRDYTLLVGRRLANDYLQRFSDMEAQLAAYEAQKLDLKAYRTQMLLALLLFTVVLLFSATWFALFLSKLVTVPIEALAQATGEIARGNFEHRVNVQAHDELGTLVASFNQMTAQLGESRRRIDESTRSLQQAVEELEARRKLMEAILENIPTGVLSLDCEGAVVRANSAVARIFGPDTVQATSLTALLGEEAARHVRELMRKARRMGTASRELALTLPRRILHAAVTVSALGPRRSASGFVVVVEDLTELLRAQRAAAWQEVAQRIAHEIKNPLTPIQLSAQRLTRYLERQPARGDEFAQLAGECATMIEREAAALKALVDEFSQFARFPEVRPVPSDINQIVAGALEVFAGRLVGVTVRTSLAGNLPTVKADPELLRRVLINLVDNAAEAMERSEMRELAVATRLDGDGEAVEISVADSGSGIPAADKDLLFLPHFSRKERGTGLGLAIASRIVAEHGGTIRVEDNEPRGARFVIHLPVAELAAPAPLAGEHTA